MNAKRFKFILAMIVIASSVQTAIAGSARDAVRQGNGLYNQGNFQDAMKKYDEAMVDNPQAMEAKFNKADSYYKLDDLTQAIDLYKQVAAESKDMKLVTDSKYNLGNCYFQQGCKQRDSNLQKTKEDLMTSIEYWRGALDIDPNNEKAAKNIEVARLTIKDIIDQMKKQQEDKKNQKQDPNQSQQQQQQQQQQQSGNQQDPNKAQDPNQQKQQGQDPNQQKQQGQDPNKSQEPNQPQKQQEKKESKAGEPNEANEPNKPDQQQAQQNQQQDQNQNAPDTTAQEILDKEQQHNKERQRQQQAGYQKVDKDW